MLEKWDCTKHQSWALYREKPRHGSLWKQTRAFTAFAPPYGSSQVPSTFAANVLHYLSEDGAGHRLDGNAPSVLGEDVHSIDKETSST